MQRSQHGERGNRRAGKLGRDILGNAGKSQHMDLKRLPGSTDRLQIFAAVVPQAEVQGLSGYGLLDHFGVPFELTLSCMNPQSATGSALHCGACSKCRERHDAFVDAGVADPTAYASTTNLK